MDGVSELGKLWMLLPNVLNHLGLRYKQKKSYQLGLKMQQEL